MTTEAAVAFKLDTLIEQQRIMQTNMADLTKAVSQLALIEERQTTDRKAVERLTESNTLLEKRLRDVEQEIPNALDIRLCALEKKVPDGLVQRVSELEMKMPMHGLTHSWVMRAAQLIVAFGIGAFLKIGN